MALRKRNQKDEAARWLEDRLKDGPVRSDLLRSEGKKQFGWSETTLLRAAEALDVLSDSRAENFQRRTWWSLPE